MEKYNIKIKSIKENEILVFADNEKEALEEVMSLLETSCFETLEIEGLTKNYCEIVLDNREN